MMTHEDWNGKRINCFSNWPAIAHKDPTILPANDKGTISPREEIVHELSKWFLNE